MPKPRAATATIIKPQKNEFDDHFLDVVGNEFKFDHAKGLAEWIKNSADAYSTTTGAKDAEQFIILRFHQGQPKKNSIFECIDFVGMTRQDLDKAFKVWGLQTAAKKGTAVATYGGHGNGGKFYMRQMFKTSRFITFRGGLLNLFGFNEQKQYGFAKGLEDVTMTIEDALAYAGLNTLDIPAEVRKRWSKKPKEAGFTIVRGEHPERFSGRSTVDTILERLRLHPQARRLLAHKQVIMMARAQKWGNRLQPPVIEPRDGFEKPREIMLPRSFSYNGENYNFRPKEYPSAKLILRTSQVPLSRSGELASLNAIDILGELGCIGSYRMNELHSFGQEAEFVYGECECPLLEDKALNCVKNDREKLVDNELTQALLEWISQQVNTLSAEMADRRRAEKKTHDLRQSSLFNQLLDKWKNRFMAKLTGELFGGPAIGDALGGIGGGAEDKVSKQTTGGGTSSDNAKESTGEKDGNGGGGGDERRAGPRFPRVLLSGQDRDPLDENSTEPYDCDPRHPPVYQRRIDFDAGIYWINTSRPFAEKLLNEYGAESARWREYLFQRYVDIIFKQSVYELRKHEPEITAEKIDSLLDDITSRVHDAAAEELERFLFEENLTGSIPATSPDQPAAEE